MYILGVLLPEFQRPLGEILIDAAIPMAITVDSTCDGLPVDFQRETGRLTDSGFRQVQSAVSDLLEILKSRPTVVLKPRIDESADDQSDADPQKGARRVGDDQGEDTEIGSSDPDLDSSTYLGIHLDDSSGVLTRDGLNSNSISAKPRWGFFDV